MSPPRAVSEEWYSTLELVEHDRSANAPEKDLGATAPEVNGSATRVHLATGPTPFPHSSSQEASFSDKEVYASERGYRDGARSCLAALKRKRYRIPVLILLLLIVLAIGIGAGVGLSKKKLFSPPAAASASSTVHVVSQPSVISPRATSSTSNSPSISASPRVSSTISSSSTNLAATATTSSVAPSVTCQWLGHCLGASCNDYNDCSDDLICTNKKCAPP